MAGRTDDVSDVAKLDNTQQTKTEKPEIFGKDDDRVFRSIFAKAQRHRWVQFFLQLLEIVDCGRSGCELCILL